MTIGTPLHRRSLRFSRQSVRYVQQSPPSHIAASQASPVTLVRPLTVYENLCCGALARIAQVMTMYPIDTIKTRVQFSRTASLSAIARLRSAIVAGAFYRGSMLSLLGQIPYGMITFGTLEYVRDRLRYRFPETPAWMTTMVAATVGDSLGSLWLTPSEVIKQKTQAGVYAGAGAATAAVARQHGFTGFYQGYGAALSRDVPFRIFQFGFFEAWKTWYANRIKRTVSPIENLIIGAMAGTSAAALTTPLDVVRTRMMAQTVGSKGAFKNGFDCVAKTIVMEGPMAMFRGIGPRCLLIGPSSAIFFLSYEAAKEFFRRRTDNCRKPAVANLAWGIRNGLCQRRNFRA